jgi:hypothetical protein
MKCVSTEYPGEDQPWSSEQGMPYRLPRPTLLSLATSLLASFDVALVALWILSET